MIICGRRGCRGQEWIPGAGGAARDAEKAEVEKVHKNKGQILRLY